MHANFDEMALLDLGSGVTVAKRLYIKIGAFPAKVLHLLGELRPYPWYFVVDCSHINGVRLNKH